MIVFQLFSFFSFLAFAGFLPNREIEIRKYGRFPLTPSFSVQNQFYYFTDFPILMFMI